MTSTERFLLMVLSFPALEQAEGVHPWDVVAFMRWACSGKSHGERMAARFVLGVWNPETDWVKQARSERIKGAAALARFDLQEAMGCWDRQNREAFLEWCRDPFWP